MTPDDAPRADLERHGGSTLVVRSDQTDWSATQRAALTQIGVDEAPEADVAVFFHVCQRTRLDPFSRQIYMIGRHDPQTGSKKWTIQTGIDGFRLVSERHPAYDGMDPIQWCGDDGVWRDVWTDPRRPPVAARCTIYRSDKPRPFTAVARYAEFVETRRDGTPNRMWATKQAHMIGKCFSEDTEVLTERGFRRFADVGDARIMQVTAGGLEAVTARPFVQDYDGLMVTLDSDDLNFSVTPNHDMVTTVGKVEAGAMYATSRTRSVWSIPRLVPPATGSGIGMTDDEIRLAAAVVADGAARNRHHWTIEVSRPRKVTALDALAYLCEDVYVRGTRGDEATSRRSGRVIRSNFDKRGYRLPRTAVAALVDDRKQMRTDTIRAMTAKQARTLVDALVEFDGTRTGGRTRRFYTSSPELLGAFELAAVIAGYAVSPGRPRISDLSDRPNYVISISDRDAIPVRLRSDSGPGMELTPNTSGRVWCVTVPSGRIVVRRNGFTMVCGNCAEALARRMAFPMELSGLYTDDEMAAVTRESDVRVADNGRQVIDAAPAGPAGGGPDWLAMATGQAGDPEALERTFKLARAARAGGDVLDAVAGLLEAARKPADEPAAEPAGTAARGRPAGRAAGEPQRKRMVLLIAEAGVTDDERRRAVQSRMAGRDLPSSKDLTNREAAAIIDQLVDWRAAGQLEAKVAELLTGPLDETPEDERLGPTDKPAEETR